jgi:hypothetical protein
MIYMPASGTLQHEIAGPVAHDGLLLVPITATAGHICGPAPAGQIPLTRNEIARLFAALTIPPIPDMRHRLRWSTWRRRHQHRAMQYHYQRQAAQS